jgi:hypothetical protein
MSIGDETNNSTILSSENNVERPNIEETPPKVEKPTQFCQSCGRKLERGTNFCPNCGRPLMLPPMPYPQKQTHQQGPPQYPYQYQYQTQYQYIGKKPNRSLIGGILTIIGACFCLVEGNYIMLFFMSGYDYYWRSFFWDIMGYWPHWGWLYIISLIFHFWGFAIGITGGILSIKKIKFPLSIIGAVFVLVSGCLAFAGTFILGIIILILGILAIIFTAVSKDEFH